MKKNRIETFENIVSSFQEIPTIGKKSAIKIAYHLLMENSFLAIKIAHLLEEGVKSIRHCKQCHNISEDELCFICSDEFRDSTTLCIVQSAKDIITIEEGGHYRGVYYIVTELSDLDEYHLKNAVKGVTEVIFAFPPSLATDTMILYIEDKLIDINEFKFTKIAQGIPSGVELDGVDILSLSRAMEARVKI